MFDATGLVRIRQECIAGMHANAVRQGIMITRPLLSEGSKLVINAQCGSKCATDVEVVDAMDQVIPGFSREDCDSFSGDEINHTVSWRGKSDMGFIKDERCILSRRTRGFASSAFICVMLKSIAMQLV